MAKESRIRDSSNLGFKGYTNVMKGLVVSAEDPENRGRLKVRIPGYHGNEDDEDKLPWAQVCITKLPSTQNGGILEFIQGLFGGSVDATSLSLSPSVGDVVWLIFEGGDINKPLIIGVLEYTARKSLQGSASGSSNFSISVGSPAYMMAQIMMKYESNNNYGAFAEAYANTSNEHAITIGAHQNYGVNAKALMVYLRSLNQSEFDRMASPSGLLADVTGSNDWSNYRISKSSAKGQAIIAIMTTDWGIKGQITKAAQDVQRYMKQANEDYGVTDTAATLYICDIIHQYGRYGARKQFSGKSIPNLETAYKIAINYSTKYKTRRNGVYNDLKQLRDSGKLNSENLPNTGSTNSSSNASSTRSISTQSVKRVKIVRSDSTDPIIDITTFKNKFMFPLLNVRNITKYYEEDFRPISGRRILHDGIDIYSPNISGQKVYAIFDGVVSYVTDINPHNGCGNQITLTYTGNNNLVAEYRHLNSRLVKEGSIVKAGDVIGTVGNTGSVPTAMLHFSLKINGGYQNPLPYLNNYDD